MNRISSTRALSLGCALAVALTSAACSSTDLAGNDLQTVSLSFTAQGTSGLAALADGRSAATSSTAAVPVISKIRLVLTKMELARTDDAACVDDDEGEDDSEHASSSTPSGDDDGDCEHVSRDPILVDMPVDGSLKTQISVPLAPGSYKMIEAKLEPASAKKAAGAAFLAAHPEFAGISVRVDGTYNGAPFAFTSRMRAGIHMNFKPPLVIDATTKNATISVDVSKWFVTNSGTVIDPTKALPGSSGGRNVEKNIRASFHAFEDNGKRGKDDGEDHGKKDR